ncbi:LuxR C-terminal-related transcriptional regulator, partial [Nocardioides sp. P5_C9_2]
LTLVSAPAGAGKTVLLSSWLATGRVPGPLLRVSTRRNPDGSAAFWAGVTTWLLAEGGGARDKLRSGPVPDIQHLGDLTRTVAARRGPVVLVVDDEVADPALHAELDQYVEEAWDSVRVVLVTRSEPRLPLHRYRLAGGLAEIRGDDLRLRRTEAAELLLGEGVALTDVQLTALLDRTRGWVAGVAYAASRLRGSPDLDATLARLTGAEPAVSDYLAREVLDAQPPDLRELMLRTSVPDELPIGLFEALSGQVDGRGAMGLLAASNAFIGPVQGTPTTYEYQPLFREFLRAQLSAERPDLVTGLHALAARWWAHCGNLHESTVHAAAAGLWSDAAAYLVENLAVGQMIDARLDTSVASLFETMPAGTPGAQAAIVRSALALRAGEVAGARAALADSRTQLSCDGSATSADAFSVELLEAALAAAECDTEHGVEALRVAERHLTTLLPSEPDLRAELRSQLALLRSGLHLWSGNLYQAKAASLDAAEAAEHRSGELALTALTQGALLAVILGDAGEASVLLEQLDERVADVHGQADRPWAGSAAVARAWLLTERSYMRAARQQVAEADQHRTHLDRGVDSLLDVVRARLMHANGEFAGSRATLDSARATLGRRRAPAWVADYIDLTAAVHAAAEGGAGPEEQEGRISLEAAQWHGDPPLELQISLAIDDAGFWLRTGDKTSAVSLLSQALGLASPHQIRRPFTEAPPAVRQLLRTHDELQVAHPWLTTSDPVGRPGVEVPTTERPAGRAGAPEVRRRLPALESRGVSRPLVVEPLTSKELEVLGYLNDLATTAEIGAAMFISVNTVRTHVRNLLRKLGADRRNDAVRRAWELGLLADPHGRGATAERLGDGRTA